jgi:hypothetical protein
MRAALPLLDQRPKRFEQAATLALRRVSCRAARLDHYRVWSALPRPRWYFNSHGAFSVPSLGRKPSDAESLRLRPSFDSRDLVALTFHRSYPPGVELFDRAVNEAMRSRFTSRDSALTL